MTGLAAEFRIRLWLTAASARTSGSEPRSVWLALAGLNGTGRCAVDFAAKFFPAHRQCGKPPRNGVERHVPLPAFGGADIVTMDSCSFPEFLLRQSSFLTQFAQHEAQGYPVRLVAVHKSRIALVHTIGLHTMSVICRCANLGVSASLVHIIEASTKKYAARLMEETCSPAC